jgi:hypothetical protein
MSRVALEGHVEEAIVDEIGRNRVSKGYAKKHEVAGRTTARLQMVGRDCVIPEVFVRGVNVRMDVVGAKGYDFTLTPEKDKMRVDITFY